MPFAPLRGLGFGRHWAFPAQALTWPQGGNLNLGVSPTPTAWVPIRPRVTRRGSGRSRGRWGSSWTLWARVLRKRAGRAKMRSAKVAVQSGGALLRLRLRRSGPPHSKAQAPSYTLSMSRTPQLRCVRKPGRGRDGHLGVRRKSSEPKAREKVGGPLCDTGQRRPWRLRVSKSGNPFAHLGVASYLYVTWRLHRECGEPPKGAVDNSPPRKRWVA